MARSLLALTALLVLASGIATSEAATITAPTIVGWIKNITTQSQNLQLPANQINLLSPALFVIGQGPFPTIVIGLGNIAATGTSAVNQLGGGTVGPFSAADQTAIFEAFRTFVQIHQALLNILIGKAGLFNTVPVIGAPVSAALRQIESVVDSFALYLINACQARAADLTSQASSLKMTIEQAIKAYDGVSVGNIQPGGRKLLSVAA